MEISTAGVLSFNSGYGSAATAYGCRAWVKFVGSSGAVSGSGNVTSVTRSAAGNYTVNFTNAMPDANYSAVVSAQGANSAGVTCQYLGTMATTSIQTIFTTYNTQQDSTYTCVAVFR